MSEPTVHQVTLWLCSLCLDGAGGMCHVPGCALCRNRAPDMGLRDSPMVESIDGVGFDYDTLKRKTKPAPGPEAPSYVRCTQCGASSGCNISCRSCLEVAYG